MKKNLKFYFSMKLSKAVLLASGIGVSSQFSFGSISVSSYTQWYNSERPLRIGAFFDVLLNCTNVQNLYIFNEFLGFGSKQKEQAG